MTLSQAGPAWLFCPADRPERFEKAAAAAAADRSAAREALVNTPLDPGRTVVRLNPASTADHALDLDALARTAYTTVMLAKSEHADQVAALAPLNVVVLVETPMGALNVVELVRA